MSIVLVILGLLVGGILVGKSLVHAGELRKTITEIDKIKTAGLTFRDKYQGLPGDLTNATSFWGAADGGDGLGSDCYTATTTDTATCNGNGNGLIDGSASSEAPEGYRFWQQLVNAGLYQGSFSGVPGTPNYSFYYHDVIGTNIPRSPLNNKAGMAIAYWWTGTVGMKKQNAMTIAPCCWSDATTRASVEGVSTSTEDLWNIDTKLDDGAPRTGSIQLYNGYGGALSATQYDLTTGVSAQPVIGLGF